LAKIGQEDTGAAFCKCPADFLADRPRRARHQGGLVVKAQVHFVFPICGTATLGGNHCSARKMLRQLAFHSRRASVAQPPLAARAGERELLPGEATAVQL